jgi:hypothetical protein
MVLFPTITDSERHRVNMGWQCPECSGVNADQRENGYECQDCGCWWDRSRYPSAAARPSVVKRPR